MIGQILGSLGGLAKSYIDAKTTVKITEAEIKKKQLTGEIDWEQSAIEASKDSWKDELWTIVFVLILAANFVPSLQDTMARGFANIETTPLWVQWGMYASIAASFGIRTMKGLKNKSLPEILLSSSTSYADMAFVLLPRYLFQANDQRCPASLSRNLAHL